MTTSTFPGNGPALSLDSLPLTTADGQWKFQPVAPGATTGYAMLNGKSTGWQGYELFVASDGKLYMKGLSRWWVWQGAFTYAADPTAPPPPPPPPPAVSLTLMPATVQSLPDNTPVGATVSSAIVTVSDGSPFTLSVSGDTKGMFAVKGLDIVTARALTSADDGTENITVTATTQSGLTAAARMM